MTCTSSILLLIAQHSNWLCYIPFNTSLSVYSTAVKKKNSVRNCAEINQLSRGLTCNPGVSNEIGCVQGGMTVDNPVVSHLALIHTLLEELRK